MKEKVILNGWQPQAQLGDGLSLTIPKACGFEAATLQQAESMRFCMFFICYGIDLRE